MGGGLTNMVRCGTLKCENVSICEKVARCEEI